MTSGQEELDRLRAGHSGGRVGCNHEGGICSDFDGYKRRAEAAEAERDDLRARLAKVERALMQGGQTDRIRWRAAVEALASVPEPSQIEED